MQTNTPKIGLALGGGATLGIAHVGVLKALTEQGVSIDCISGTSAGALVAACFAFGMPVSQMIDISKNLDWKKISRFGYSKLGINTNTPMAVFITDLLGDVHIEDAKVPLAIVATDIESYEMVVLRKGRLHDAVRASTCVPGLFAPVEINGRLLVDGGLVENVPLSLLNEMGATIKIGVNLSANPLGVKPKNLFDVLINSYTVLSRHRDSSLVSKANIIIEPNLNKFDYTKFKDAEQIFEEGYRATLKAIPLIKERISVYQSQKKGLFAKFLSLLKIK